MCCINPQRLVLQSLLLIGSYFYSWPTSFRLPDFGWFNPAVFGKWLRKSQFVLGQFPLSRWFTLWKRQTLGMWGILCILELLEVNMHHYFSNHYTIMIIVNISWLCFWFSTLASFFGYDTVTTLTTWRQDWQLVFLGGVDAMGLQPLLQISPGIRRPWELLRYNLDNIMDNSC